MPSVIPQVVSREGSVYVDLTNRPSVQVEALQSSSIKQTKKGEWQSQDKNDKNMHDKAY